MRILITNDDGIHSDGLWALAEALNKIGEVHVVAPDRDQSGVGTGMTLLTVVRAIEVASPIDGVAAHAVDGTPADCVILATGSIYSEPFDLMFSGINRGANIGMDVLVSGTVGGALHGYLRGIPSVALSVVYTDTEIRYDVAAQVGSALGHSVVKLDSPTTPFLNVNLPPDVDSAGIRGVDVTKLGSRAYLESVEKVDDGRRTHYWIRHNRQTDEEPEKGTDLWAVKNDRVSITPLGPIVADGKLADGLSTVRDGVSLALGLT